MKIFNHQITLNGGQAFNWKFTFEHGAVGFMQHCIVFLVSPEGKESRTEVYGDASKFDEVSYFNEKRNLSTIFNQYQNDEYITKALDSFSELRILGQDFEQTLLSFILTSHKNIKAVKKLIWDLSQKYGDPIETPYGTWNTFPKTEILSNVPEEDLRKIGCGFRAVYLKEAAIKLVKDRDLFKQFTTREEWEDYLITFKGIGEKVRDCVLVFGLGFTDITPLDIWAKRILTDFYGVDSKLNYSVMREIFTKKFGENTAIIGQYLFEYIRLPKE